MIVALPSLFDGAEGERLAFPDDGLRRDWWFCPQRILRRGVHASLSMDEIAVAPRINAVQRLQDECRPWLAPSNQTFPCTVSVAFSEPW